MATPATKTTRRKKTAGAPRGSAAAAESNLRANVKPSPGEVWLAEDELTQGGGGAAAPEQPGNPLDGDHPKKVLRQLLSWYFEERERQSVNRYQMAIDHDFYDNLQWSEEDAAEVESRGQMAIAFNEVAAMVDWVIGTERRTRVDWRILPRGPSDVATADVKTKVMKYVSDVNKVPFKRSRAFDDAVKVGIGWIEDGARADPTEDILYSRYESWRNILHDSSGLELDCTDGRYQFRWKWVDLDVAVALFPKREGVLRAAAVNQAQMDYPDDEDFYYLGQRFNSQDRFPESFSRRQYTGDPFLVGSRRRRVKLIEGWYKVPTKCQFCEGAPFDGKPYDDTNPGMVAAKAAGYIGVIDSVIMKMHYAIFTEKALLAMGPSPYRHNRFPFTPIWCFRRGRDGMPYGMIRRMRDIQEDLNKRMSKSLFLLSTNQIIMEEGAVDDIQEARDEVDKPDGVIVVKKGKLFEIRRDTEAAKGHAEFAQMDAQKIQNSGGVNNENLGRQSNAVSGEAIKARQSQGSVQTTQVFDNHRYAIQTSGEKQLSNIEQFYTLPKVIRLTEAKGPIQWLHVNQPEVQPDGSVRFLNDITAEQADFVVSEQDYHGSLRQAMFEAMMEMVTRPGMSPEVAMRLLRMAFEYSDMPNKDEIVAEIRKIIGEPDPNKEPTPEEMQAIEQQRAMQQAAFEQSQMMAMAAIAKAQAEAKKINAEAEKVIAEIQAMSNDQGGVDADGIIEAAVRTAQADASAEVERVMRQLVQKQGEVERLRVEIANRTFEVNKKADTELEVARIQADADKHASELEKSATDKLRPIHKRIDDLHLKVKEAKMKKKATAKA